MSTAHSALAPYGVVTLDGTQYIERPQIFTVQTVISNPYQVLTNQRFTLPGTANFLLKGLTRDFSPLPSVPAACMFRFKLTNAEGSVWYFTGGLGLFTDRVVDTCCFGTAQFPYPLIPPVPLSASATLIYEVEDMATSSDYPYAIFFCFHGSLLIPVSQASDTQSVVYAVGAPASSS